MIKSTWNDTTSESVAVVVGGNDHDDGGDHVDDDDEDASIVNCDGPLLEEYLVQATESTLGGGKRSNADVLAPSRVSPILIIILVGGATKREIYH